MNIRKLLFLSLALCISMFAVSCSSLRGIGRGGAVPGSGTVQTETRRPGPFEAINIDYPADVTIQQGFEDSVVIETDDNLLRQLFSEVNSGRLTVKTVETNWQKRVNPSQPVKITITMRNLKEIVFSAPTGSLDADGLHIGALKLVLSGAAQVHLNGLEVDLLDAVLSGAGDVKASGTSREVRLLLSGAGSFSGADLKSDKAGVEISGMGHAIVCAATELTANITGAGSVRYYGEPRVEQTISGAGSVKPAD